MTIAVNQNIAADATGDRVDPGLGPKTPAISTDRQGHLPHAAYRSTVDSPNDKAGKRKKNSAPAPAVSNDVIRKVRRGGAIAMLLAAGISARTLFQLGQIIGLPWQFAWMLPGAFDVYAYTSATVAASVPAAHPARAWAVWNARVALSFTMIGNSLVHALYLMSHGQQWTGTDYALTAVSAIPPIIVERLLHLQTKIASGAEVPTADADEKSKAPTSSAPTGADRRADRSADALTASAPTADRIGTAGTVGDADEGADVIDLAAAGAAAKRNTEQWAVTVLPVYRRYITTHRGEEPNAPQLAEAIKAAGLGELGKSRARDVRKATEVLHAATPWPESERSEAAR